MVTPNKISLFLLKFYGNWKGASGNVAKKIPKNSENQVTPPMYREPYGRNTPRLIKNDYAKPHFFNPKLTLSFNSYFFLDFETTFYERY